MSTRMVTVRKTVELLEKEGPLHYRKIAEKLIGSSGIEPRGKDPAYTVYADLFFHTKDNVQDSPLVMTGRGVFALKSHGEVDPSMYTPERLGRPKKELTIEEIDVQISQLKDLRKELVAKSKETVPA